jgi:hypothetical protein
MVMPTLLAGFGSFVIGLAVVLYAIVCGGKGLLSIHWPTTTGVITHFALRSIKGVDGDLLRRVCVAYQFNDGQFERKGSRLCFGDALYSAMPHKHWPLYAVGDVVEVSYNPRQPDDSVLRPGIRREVYETFFLGAVLATIGLLVVFAV